MALTRKAGSALWHQVEQTLAQDIIGGTLAVGTQLPTEPVLMARFGVSRFTVRQAIANLERRGLVRAEQGRGTFVQSHILTYPISAARFSRNLIEQGFDPGGEVVFETVIPPAPISRRSCASRFGNPLCTGRASAKPMMCRSSLRTCFYR